MKQTFVKNEDKLINVWEQKVGRSRRWTVDNVVDDEENAPDSCFICIHYKFNPDNRKKDGKFVHICMGQLPELVDLTNKISHSYSFYCEEWFLRRVIQ